MFEKNKSYDFQFKELRDYGGKTYLMLSYGENQETTLPGYENTCWRYRVEAYDYQLWDKNPTLEIIPCRVVGFQTDSSGRETSFPFLKQDLECVLYCLYTPGPDQRYSFTVSEKKDSNTYLLSDAYGLKHQYKTKDELECGEDVELIVEAIEGHYLKFADDSKQKLQEIFEPGKDYSFIIQSKEIDPKGKQFYWLTDKIESLKHRFYFLGNRQDKTGDEILLTFKEFTKSGRLFLTDPNTPIADETGIQELEYENSGLENKFRERKSSLIYTKKSEKNIDEQLGSELMRQLASFMNAEGGCVYIGYRDDGQVCGIENEVYELNTSEEDEYQYRPNWDGVELKIRNTIIRHLGGYANSLTDIKFYKSQGHIVCHIEVKASDKPIYLNEMKLYKRAGNMCQLLKGDDITSYIKARMNLQIKSTVPTTQVCDDVSNIPLMGELTKEDMEALYSLSTLFSEQNVQSKKPWTYFSFYSDGCISRQKEESSDVNVLLNVPLSSGAKNKSARLLLCYNNGCVNIVNPKNVFDDKLKESRKHYKNGWNTGAKLLNVYECCKDDFLVIRSKKPDGEEMIKAVCIGNYKVHTGLSIQTQGNRIVDPKIATVTNIEVIPSDQQSFIFPVVQNTKNSMPGISTRKLECQGVLSFLKHRKNDDLPQETPTNIQEQ